MAPRANWKGYLRLSLVSCPIALYPASSLSEKISFNRINRKTGNRLKQQNVDSETGEVVSREDIARGYEVAKGQYLLVEDDELDAVQIESTHTIDIDQFVLEAVAAGVDLAPGQGVEHEGVVGVGRVAEAQELCRRRVRHRGGGL